MEHRRNLLTAKLPRKSPNRTLRRNVGRRHLPTEIQYLENVRIPGANDLESMLKDAFHIRSFSEIRDRVRYAIQSLRSSASECTSRTEWISCTNKCNSVLTAAIKTELESTAYILRILAMSVISVDGSRLEFSANGPLTGIWADDAPHIRIQTLNRDTSPSRLVLGLGPSASGKTYWAKSLIDMMSEHIPKTFLSIDGGIYRQGSIVYHYIVEEAKSICVAGFDNLMLSSWKLTESSMFNTGGVKKAVIHFLKQQTIPISLYVPETLGDCGYGRLKYCYSKLDQFIKITKDARWIAIMIWQHKYATECSYSPLFKCTGCTESGTVREKEEGKKYSNKAYEHSMEEGMKVMEDAPGGAYSIHNSGHRRRKSILTDFTSYDGHGELQIQRILASPINMNKYNYMYKRHRPSTPQRV